MSEQESISEADFNHLHRFSEAIFRLVGQDDIYLSYDSDRDALRMSVDLTTLEKAFESQNISFDQILELQDRSLLYLGGARSPELFIRRNIGMSSEENPLFNIVQAIHTVRGRPL